MTTAVSSVMPRPRSPELPFEGVPRHWFADSALFTHLVNGVSLLFPAGERFFVRAVRHYMDQIDDPALREQVKGFFGQEGRHASAHDRFTEILEAQGYDLARFLRVYEAIAYRGIERISPPALRLSVTVALEHFTAILAEDALSDGFLDAAHPAVRRLLLWHASEEIEHKAVAFDVLRQVAPSYPLRVAGLALGASCLGAFWVAATVTLLAQDEGGLSRATLRKARTLRELSGRTEGIVSRVFLRGIREYLRPDFHPWQKDNGRLAREWLTSAGLA